MKKTSILLSTALLLGQFISCSPIILAEEEQTIALTEQSTTSDAENVANEGSNVALEETTTTDTSESNSDQPTKETTDSTTDSSINNTQSTDSRPEETIPSTSDSNLNQEQTKPSESKPVTKPNATKKPTDNQEVSRPEKPVENTTNEMSQQVPFVGSYSTEPQTKKEEPLQVDQANKNNEETNSFIDKTSKIVATENKGSYEAIHFEKNKNVESFIRKIGESARKVGKANNLYASVMIAQAVLESASGQSALAQAPNYNLFGIKGEFNGKSVSFATQEDVGNGELYTIRASFRQYKNYEESLNDYAKLLKEGLTGNRDYYHGVWKTSAKTYKEATRFLTGRYATDTKYDQKLNGLIETFDLTKYDKEIAGPELSQKGYIVPVKNYTISSPFGEWGGEFHRGVDFAAAQGEPIYASKSGVVIKAEFHPSWGNVVAIEHEDGNTTLYAHQQEYQVKVGDKVEQGQIIGYVGSTGNSTGSHLHFEFCVDNSLVQSQLRNPMDVLNNIEK